MAPMARSVGWLRSARGFANRRPRICRSGPRCACSPPPGCCSIGRIRAASKVSEHNELTARQFAAADAGEQRAFTQRRRRGSAQSLGRTMKLRPDHLQSRWAAIRAACERHGASDRWLQGKGRSPKFDIGRPASESDVRAIEQTIDRGLPLSFRNVLLEYSSSVDVAWQLPDAIEPPFRGIFSGECRWSLQSLPSLLESHRSWLKECFNDPSNPYAAVWHDKLPFLQVGNGDFVTIDLSNDTVVYLSHDDGEGHGFRLGADFEDYVDRSCRLGCVGTEDWQWIHFTTGSESFLLPDSENGKSWQRWFGL